MDKNNLVFEDFKDRVGSLFMVSEDEFPPITLTLGEAKLLSNRNLRPDIRPPFSLTFLAEDPRVLPQRIYRLEHREMGDFTIFLVPMGKDQRGVSYEAVFN